MLIIYNYFQACVFVPYKIFKDPITKWQWIVANFRHLDYTLEVHTPSWIPILF
jgi:hypothetical protein